MFTTLARGLYRGRWVVLGAGLLFLGIAALYGTSVFGRLKLTNPADPAAQYIAVDDLLRTQFHQDQTALLVLFTAHDGATVDSPAYQQAVAAVVAPLARQPGVGDITSFYTTHAPAFVSTDRHSTYVVVGLRGDDAAQQQTLDALRPQLQSDRLQIRLGGGPVSSQEGNEEARRAIEQADLITFPILAILLVFVFGSLVAASLPLAMGGFAILGALLVMRVATEFIDVSVYAVNIIIMLGLGLAIDYSLFVVSRFREELARMPESVVEALARTMQTAGRTILFSGLTVTISLLSLAVFPGTFFKSIGLAAAASVAVAMLAALTVLPAILAALGPRINAWAIPVRWRRWTPSGAASMEQGFWYRTSQFVMRYPVPVLLLTLIPLLILGLPFLRARIQVPDVRALPSSFQSGAVYDSLLHDFPPNETQPIILIVQTPGAALDPASLRALYAYTRQLQALPGVRRVDSLVTLSPQLDEAAYQGLYSAAARALNPLAQRAATTFAAGNYSWVHVLYDSDPLGPESQALVGRIRALPPGDLQILVGGDPAYQVDYLASLGRGVPVAGGLIVGVIFVLLFLMLGSLVVPLTAVILNIVSLSVSFGALVWIFQDGHLANLLGFESLGSIDALMPVIIFAIAFGLSMDYEVFLLSRVKEHFDQSGDNRAAVAVGVQKTGGIITSAALLLVIVIGGFAAGAVLQLKEFGVGLALAVFVDATVVRMLLVPATMRLLGKYNWWAPAPLTAVYRRLGLSDG